MLPQDTDSDTDPEPNTAEEGRGGEGPSPHEYRVDRVVQMAWTKSHDWIPDPIVARKHHGFNDRPPYAQGGKARVPPHAAAWMLHKSCPASMIKL